MVPLVTLGTLNPTDSRSQVFIVTNPTNVIVLITEQLVIIVMLSTVIVHDLVKSVIMFANFLFLAFII